MAWEILSSRKKAVTNIWTQKFTLKLWANLTLSRPLKTGLCECLSEFEKKPDRTCVTRAFILPSSSSTILSQPHQADSGQQSAGAIAAGVISALIVIVALCIGLFLAHRHRLLPRLRAKLSNSPYEDIVISDRSQLAASSAAGRNHNLP
jgi:hypothetical protein